MGSVCSFIPQSGGAAARVLFLDIYGTDPYFCHSWFQERDGHTDPAVTIRRSSDNAELDVYYASTGNYYVTDALAAAWIVAAGPANAFLTKKWDNGTNGNHLTQTTAARQPKVWDTAAGDWITEGGIISEQYDGVDDFMNFTNLVTTGINWTRIEVKRRQVAGTPGITITERSSDGPYSANLFLDGNNYVSNQLNYKFKADATTARHMWADTNGQSVATLKEYKDGAEVAGLSSGGLIRVALLNSISKEPPNSQTGKHQFSYMALTDRSAEVVAMMDNINQRYGVY